MKRRLLIVAIFLLAGAVVNHLVASLFVLLFATANDSLPAPIPAFVTGSVQS